MQIVGLFHLQTKKVIFVGAFRFPDGDAAAARVLGIGKSIRALGRDVVFAGWEPSGREQDRRSDGSYSYQGFPYYSQNELRVGHLSPAMRVLRYLTAGRNTLDWLKCIDLENVEAIVSYHGGSFFLYKLAIFCKEKGIKLIVDCTEWYDGASLPGGRLGIPHIDSELRMRVLNNYISNVIVISGYLERYYCSRGCEVVRIPPTIDFSDQKWAALPGTVSVAKHLRLVYAGVPAKKDLLSTALYGLLELRKMAVPVTLELLGPTRDDLIRCVDGNADLIGKLSDSLLLRGRVAQSDVPRIVAECDFSILLRPDKRYAHAGFSTKLVESLAAGVPVIANQTGDIGLYVRDGLEGIVLHDHSVKSFVAGVVRAQQFSPETRNLMRNAARKKAEESFDYHAYSEPLATFFSRI